MEIARISPTTLRDVLDAEVLSLHHRVHQLWGAHFAESATNSAAGLSREDLVNAHRFLIEELQRRDLSHHARDTLDKVALGALELTRLPERLLVVGGFIAVVGSTAARGYQAGHDVDVLVRAEQDDRGHFLLGADNVHLPVRKALDPEKRALLHWIDNPQGPHAAAVSLYDLMLVRRPDLPAALAAEFDPARYRVMKPAMVSYTEFFSTTELWTAWAQARRAAGQVLLGSPKIDGFRSVLWSAAGKLQCRFEDGGETRAWDIPFPAGLVLEGEFTARSGGKWLARTQLAGVATRKLPGVAPFWWLYDALQVGGEAIYDQPFSERLTVLRKVTLAPEHFRVLEQRPVDDAAELTVVGRWAAAEPLSEGLFLREAAAPYHFGSTVTAAKLRTVFELKVLVLDVIERQNGHVYRCGLREPGERFVNLVERAGRVYLDLGNTFVTRQDLAGEGDTLNVRIEELIEGETAGRPVLFWGKPLAVGKDTSRPAYTVAQAVDLARRGGVYKRELELAAGVEPDIVAEDTRGARATAFWRDHWHESFPAAGQGDFVYQHHWRGLTQEQAQLAEDELFKGADSVHGDLRLSFGSALWGFTVFLGQVSDLRGGRDLATLAHDDALQGAFKLHQPGAWLTVARGQPLVVQPGGVGGTSRAYSKFFEIAHGRWQMGVWREHFFELWLEGGPLHGRFLIEYAQRPAGARYWQIVRPAEQAPYAQSHQEEAVVAELRRKKQPWLIWAAPGIRPRKIATTEVGDG